MVLNLHSVLETHHIKMQNNSKNHLHIKSFFCVCVCLMIPRAVGEWVRALWRCLEERCILLTYFCGTTGERINPYPPSSLVNVNKTGYFTVSEEKEHNGLTLHLCNCAV